MRCLHQRLAVVLPARCWEFVYCVGCRRNPLCDDLGRVWAVCLLTQPLVGRDAPIGIHASHPIACQAVPSRAHMRAELTPHPFLTQHEDSRHARNHLPALRKSIQD